MKKKSFKSTPNTMVLVSKEIERGNGDADSLYLEVISLRHPRSNHAAKFVFNAQENAVYELLKFSQPCRSWFIGNTVCSDGDLYLSTSIDPLFLVLPYFHKAKMSSTVDQLIYDEEFRDTLKLETLFADNEQLSLIAKKKDCGGMTVWKYDEDKALLWLAHKVKRVSTVLEERGINVNTSCAVSNSFVKSVKDTPENYLRYAHGMISEYLVPELSEKLSSFMKIPPPEVVSRKRKSSLTAEDIKRIKMECKEKEILEAEQKKEKTPAKKNTRQIALAKAAVGSKSISVFFKKKD